MKEDPAPRRENTDPIVFGVTTFRSGGVWRPKEEEPSEYEASREKERRELDHEPTRIFKTKNAHGKRPSDKKKDEGGSSSKKRKH